MSMMLITGSYQVLHDRPDGDTVHFLPQDPGYWCDVPGRNRVDRDEHGGASLRLDAIDALETHYQGVGPDFAHQPLGLGAHAARDELLTWLGFTEVVQDDQEKVTASTPAAVPGYILTGGADVFHRCVALVGRGAPPNVGDPPKPARSGFRLDVTPDLLHQTVNHHLLSLGLVYPTFYQGLPDALRADLTATAQQARTARAPGSVWLHDVTTTGAKIENLESITEDLVMLPKLFRRLVDYVRLFGPGLGCLPAFLAGGTDEFTLPERPKPPTVGLQHVVEVTDGSTVRMTRPVEDLLFAEK
ncbi:nuclease [Kitasatospora sp. NPDC048545]|uniref:nuclease n=1 Tax=Kitasatospora sp. NPDC048545 TaxID=3157208 RepID=UPI0033D80A10